MRGLRAFQEEFKRLVFFQETEPASSSLWKDGLPPRLGVYRNNTRANWTDALDSDFPMTRRQFTPEGWKDLSRRYFLKHPPRHWELNASLAPFTGFIAAQKLKPWVKELADYEWNDLRTFIDRSAVRRGTGLTNPTAVVSVYHHQIFDWVDKDQASPERPPRAKPEVLVFHRDSRNTRHIREADPLMLLMLEHFRRPGAALAALEPARRRLLPGNEAPLETVHETLRACELIL